MKNNIGYYMYAWSPAYQIWFRPLINHASDINQTYKFAEDYMLRSRFHITVVEASIDPSSIPRPPTDYRK